MVKAIAITIKIEVALAEHLEEIENVSTLRINVRPAAFDVGGPVLRMLVGRIVGTRSEGNVRLTVDANVLTVITEPTAAQILHHRREGNLERWSAGVLLLLVFVGFFIALGHFR